MFDKAIIDTDRFMDLSMSSKALYFLLGMEADDEGFVSYKKVMRIHGGNEDDMKLLVVKGFLIHFDSGVVVITDWNKNNWLDVRRSKPTEYKKEREQLSLTDGGEYVLSTCLAFAEPEEKSRVESSIEEKREESEQDSSQSLEVLDSLNTEAWDEWLLYKKSKRKKVSPLAQKKQRNFLSRYSAEEQQQIVNYSVQNDYQGLFEPKRNNTSGSKKVYAA